MADKIHGFDIVAQFSTQAGHGLRAGRFILVDRGEAHEGRERWVSTWQGEGDDEWAQGNYYNDYEKAREHFLDRCKREPRRGA